MLSKKLKRVEPIIIGLWRFYHVNWKTPQWCCTWRYRGSYYDTLPKTTPDAALNAVYLNWKKVKKRRKAKRAK